MLGKLANLDYLNVEHNQLASLPKTLFNLGKLSTLLLFDNKLTELPEEVGMLRSLKRLDIECNQIKKFPKTISLLIYLEGTPLIEQLKKKKGGYIPGSKPLNEDEEFPMELEDQEKQADKDNDDIENSDTNLEDEDNYNPLEEQKLGYITAMFYPDGKRPIPPLLTRSDSNPFVQNIHKKKKKAALERSASVSTQNNVTPTKIATVEKKKEVWPPVFYPPLGTKVAINYNQEKELTIDEQTEIAAKKQEKTTFQPNGSSWFLSSSVKLRKSNT